MSAGQKQHEQRQLARTRLTEEGSPPAKRARLEGSSDESPPGIPMESPVVTADTDMEDIPNMRKLPASDAVYFGTIKLFQAKAQVTCSKIPGIRKSPWRRFSASDVTIRGSRCVVLAGADEELGILDKFTTSHLIPLQAMEGVKFEAIMIAADLETNRQNRKAKVVFDISVNILGPSALFSNVGEVLEVAQVSLQHPVWTSMDLPYVNPHWYYGLGRQPTDLRHLIGPQVDQESSRVSMMVEDVLASLDASDEPLPVSSRPSACTDSASTSRTPGQQQPATYLSMTCANEAPHLKSLRTELKQHQKQGVEFMLSREDSRKRQDTFSQIKLFIGPGVFSGVHFLPSGGILADVMGLGKTLTAIGTIVALKDTASAFGAIKTDPDHAPCSRATLIVTSSRQVLDVWASEIEKHLEHQTLSVSFFHGPSRESSKKNLADHDVVLTTYGTLAADLEGKRKLLQSIFWFRIILDEAREIKNTSTRKFKAACQLQADRRWCLTGTPIQNSLDDLQSLLRFTRLELFSTRSTFADHIVNPLSSGLGTGSDNLRVLLKAVCIRRDASYLQLPPLVPQIVEVSPSADEKAEEARIVLACQKACDKIVSRSSTNQTHSIVWTTILKLRRLYSGALLTSNNLSFGPLLGAPSARIEATESDCERCRGLDDDSKELLDGAACCPDCSRILQEPSLSRGSPALGGSAGTPGTKSPTPHDVTSPRHHSDTETTQGLSSKLDKVLENIEQHQAESKSLVFSSWKSTLVALAALLRLKNIAYVQVDGRLAPNARREPLRRFQEEDEVRVLLMTLDTGAVGLTLTAADRVHLVGPHWNPTVEDQAIARAHRMGQTRPVTVIRYISENSVEVEIAKRQEHKKRLANISLGSGSSAGASHNELQDLQSILSFGNEQQ